LASPLGFGALAPVLLDELLVSLEDDPHAAMTNAVALKASAADISLGIRMCYVTSPLWGFK